METKKTEKIIQKSLKKQDRVGRNLHLKAEDIFEDILKSGKFR